MASNPTQHAAQRRPQGIGFNRPLISAVLATLMSTAAPAAEQPPPGRSATVIYGIIRFELRPVRDPKTDSITASPSVAQTIPPDCQRVRNHSDFSAQLNNPDPDVHGYVHWPQPASVPVPDCYVTATCDFDNHHERLEQLMQNYTERVSRGMALVDVQFRNERTGRCYVITTEGRDPTYRFKVYPDVPLKNIVPHSPRQGRFLALDIPPGTYTITIDHPPFRRITARVRINLRQEMWEARKKNGEDVFQGEHEILEGMRKPGATTDGLEAELIERKDGSVFRSRFIDGLHFDLQLPADSIVEADALTVRADDRFSLASSLPTSTTRLSGDFIAASPLAPGPTLQSVIPLIPGLTITESTGTLAQFTAIGARRSENRLSIDGAAADLGVAVGTLGIGGEEGSQALPALSTTGGTQAIVPAEAVQEIEVRTAAAPSRNAQSSGAQMIVTTKAGTNDYRGSAFFNGRAFGASERSFLTGGQRAAATSSNAGGSVGGPIVRSRAFFFGVGEYQHITRPFAFTPEVPPPSARENASPAVRPIVESFGLPADGVKGYPVDLPQRSYVVAASARIDANFRAHHRAFARYNSGYSRGDAYISWSAPSVRTTERTTTNTITAGMASMLPSGFVNDFRVNVTAHRGYLTSELPSAAAQALGLDGSRWARLNIMPGPGGFLIGGETGDASQQQVQITDNVTVLRGRHEWRAGIDLSRTIARSAAASRRDTYLFADLNQFLSGHVRQVLSESVEPAEVEFRNLAAYAEHTVTLGKRLSVNFGVRYSVAPAPASRTKIEPVFLRYGALPGFDQLPRGSRAWSSTSKLAPRAGIAYRVMSSDRGYGSAVSVSWARVYDELSRPGAVAYGRSLPYVTRGIFRPASFPAAAADMTIPENSPLLAEYFSFVDDLRTPRTDQWYVGLDQELRRAGRVKVAYVTTRARDLVYFQRLVAGPLSQSVNIYDNAARSSYRALLIDYTRPLARGLSISAAYAWSRARDTDSGDTPAPNPPHWLVSPKASYGRADFDRPHVARVEGAYQSRATRPVLAGWQVSAAARLQSGAPVNVVAQHFLAGNETVSFLRPDIVPGVPQWLPDPSVPTGRRINPQAFTPSTSGQHGTLPRNALRAASLRQVDLALNRTVAVHRGLRVDLRASAYNVFNLANYGPPWNVLNLSTFGSPDRSAAEAFGTGTLSQGGLTPVQQQGGARAFQFGARLTW